MTTHMGRYLAIGVLAAAGCGDNLEPDPNDLGFLKISKLGGLETTEAGGSDSFEVSLIGAPRENFVVTFASTNTDEGRVDVDDTIVDGDQLVQVLTDPCTSADPVYNLFDPRNINVLNRDND